MEHLRYWTNDLLKTMEEQLPEEKLINIIESCGKICASTCGVFKEIDKLPQELGTTNIEELIKTLNVNNIAGGNLSLIDGKIVGHYNTCYCPTRKLIESEHYCNCTKGWAKTVFEKILDQPVSVELTKTIHKGDKKCEFIITF